MRFEGILPAVTTPFDSAGEVDADALHANVAALLDAGDHLARIAEFADAGFSHVTVQQCGDDQERLIALYAEEILPQVRAPTSPRPA